jgi:hypothetical protein
VTFGSVEFVSSCRKYIIASSLSIGGASALCVAAGAVGVAALRGLERLGQQRCDLRPSSSSTASGTPLRWVSGSSKPPSRLALEPAS